ncbi:MAG: folate-binding protein [Methylococcales bacterium]|nr:folate-binding protein [Methylococcales bacterium]
MNKNWKNFLLSQNAIFESDTHIAFPAISDNNGKFIYPVAHLALLTVSGKDAAKLLQGQITCNINDINETKSSLGAICNPKGRAVTTFLLIKTGTAFLMVLPQELLEPVRKRLQMYILRSDVTLTDSSDDLCIIGLYDPAMQAEPLLGTSGTTQQDTIAVTLSNRYLVIAEADKAIALWTERVNHQGFQPEDSDKWRYLDIVSGIPWLTTETSEEFIPQMLNLDMLGGISFNKGCYTGQEIIARTHYLGKAKRAMFLAECNTPVAPEPDSTVIDADTDQPIGKVLQAQYSRAINKSESSLCKMLLVLQLTGADTYNLKLIDINQKITLLTLPL